MTLDQEAKDELEERLTVERLASEVRLVKSTKLAREQADEFYAFKWTEKVLAGMIGVVLLTVLGAILALVVTVVGK
jgi:hypothetical protein